MISVAIQTIANLLAVGCVIAFAYAIIKPIIDWIHDYRDFRKETIR